MIKNCPFCDGKASVSYFEDDKVPAYVIGCSSCGVGLPREFETREEATLAWNKRKASCKMCINRTFVEHIQAHLKPEQHVICKICNKDILTIYQEETERRHE